MKTLQQWLKEADSAWNDHVKKNAEAIQKLTEGDLWMTATLRFSWRLGWLRHQAIQESNTRYEKARDSLVAGAARATDHFTEDELEQYAAEQEQKEKQKNEG